MKDTTPPQALYVDILFKLQISIGTQLAFKDNFHTPAPKKKHF